MSTKVVVVLTALLALGAGLAWTNPTEQAYHKFQASLLREVIEGLESSRRGGQPAIITKLFKSKNSVFLESLVQSQTVRRDFVLCSLFETTIFSTQLVVLGIGGEFIPITHIEDALREVEQSVLSPRR